MQATTTQAMSVQGRLIRPSATATAAVAALIGALALSLLVANGLRTGSTAAAPGVASPAGDPVAAGQAELDGWMTEMTVTAPVGAYRPVPGVRGGTADPGSDPVAAGQAELDGWAVR